MEERDFLNFLNQHPTSDSGVNNMITIDLSEFGIPPFVLNGDPGRQDKINEFSSHLEQYIEQLCTSSEEKREKRQNIYEFIKGNM